MAGDALVTVSFLGSRHWTKKHREAHWKQFDAFARSEEPAYRRVCRSLWRAERAGAMQLVDLVLEEEDRASASLPLERKDGPVTRESLERFRDRLGARYDGFHQRWLDEYERLVRTTTEIVGDSLAAELGVSFSVLNPRIQDFMQERVNLLVGDMVNGGVPHRTFRAIMDTVEQGHLAGESVRNIGRRVTDVFGRGYYRQAPDGTVYQVLSAEQRGNLIARTETTANANGAALATAKESGLELIKFWVSQGDDRVRDEHLEEEAASEESPPLLEEPFPITGLDYPQEPNCRCTMFMEQRESPRRERGKSKRWGVRVRTRRLLPARPARAARFRGPVSARPPVTLAPCGCPGHIAPQHVVA